MKAVCLFKQVYKMVIKNIVFDLGGVIMDLDRERSVRRFEELGVKDAGQLIDPYEQKGIFLEVENGKATAEEFQRKLSEHAGRELSMEELSYGWMGFIVGVPQYKLDYMLELRKKYNVYVLSNTNPFIMANWAKTKAFSEAGRPLDDYCEKIYASYEIGVTKPHIRIFEYMLEDSGMIPSETLFIDDGQTNVKVGASLGMQVYQPANKEDWREAITAILDK